MCRPGRQCVASHSSFNKDGASHDLHIAVGHIASFDKDEFVFQLYSSEAPRHAAQRLRYDCNSVAFLKQVFRSVNLRPCPDAGGVV